MAIGEDLRFILDECIMPKGLAEALRLFELNIVTLAELGCSGVQDEDWIPAVAQDGLILITSDRQLHKRRIQREVLRRNGVTAFFLYEGFSQLPGLKQISFITGHWETIVQKASKARAGELFTVSPNGKVKPVA